MQKIASNGFRELLSKKKYKQALEFAETNNAFEQLIHAMSDNNHYKVAIGFIQQKGLQLSGYPALEERAMKKCVRYLISACDDWEQTELQLLGSKQLLAYFAEDLFFKSTQNNHHKKVFKGTRKNKGKPQKNGNAPNTLFAEEEEDESNTQYDIEKPEVSKSSVNFGDIALSIVHRHGLQTLLKKNQIINGLTNPFTVVQNSVILDDAFSRINSLCRAYQSTLAQLPHSRAPGHRSGGRQARD